MCFPIMTVDSCFQACVYVADTIYSNNSKSVHFSKKTLSGFSFRSWEYGTSLGWERSLRVPFLLQQTFSTELMVLTLCHVAHNKMPYRNISMLFQSTYLIKKSLSVTGKDIKLFWQNWYSIKSCWLTLAELQLLIYCF